MGCSQDYFTPPDGEGVEGVERIAEQLTFVEADGLVSMEAENFTTNQSQGGKNWTLQTVSGTSGGRVMAALPDTGAAVDTGYTTNSPRLNFQVTFAQSGTYHVWIRGRAGGASAADSDSLHVGLNGNAVASADRITGFSGSYGWSRATMDNVNATLSVPSAGVHTVNVWMREDGFIFDKMVLTRNSSFTPSGNGPNETARATCTNGATQPGTTVCGLNGRGRFQQQCVSGQWQNTTTCVDPDVCVDGAARAGSTACGLNGRGTLNQVCAAGAWTNTNTCVDPDACVDGATQPGTTPCAGGTLQRVCSSGQWTDSTQCLADYCGDGICNRRAQENCSSCAADCGVCLPDAYLEASGTVVFEAERFDSQTLNGSPDTWSSANDSGAGGGQLMRLLPDNGHNYTSNVTTSSARLDYRVNFQNSGTWYMWIRGKSTTSAGYESDSCWGGINNTLISTLFDFPENGSFAWVRQTFTVPSAGVHTINVWGREDGFYLDRVVLVRSSSYTPSGVGPAESARGASGFCGDGQCTGTEDCSSCANDCGSCGCTEGATQPSTTVCGLNGRGRFTQLCSSGVWNDTTTCVDPDVCNDGNTQTGTTTCGLNGRGLRQQSCVTGQWQNTATCLDPDVCADGAARLSTTTCGLNARGRLQEQCVIGAWQLTASCIDADVCADGAVRSGTTPCGLNGRGALAQQCALGQWQDSTTCADSDICVDGATQPSGESCGLNDRGMVLQLCVSGVWGASYECSDPDVCVDGVARSGPTTCGFNGRGRVNQICSVGAWQNTGECVDPDECVDGNTRPGSGTCGLNGRGQTQELCTSGVWGASAGCSDPDVCVDGSARTGTTACGLNGAGTLNQLCSVGAWVDTAACQDPDECVNGSTRPGTTACGLNGRGSLDQVCSAGAWANSSTCVDADVCVDGSRQAGTTPCGAGGTLERVCTSGQWVNSTQCVLPNFCGDGTCNRQNRENCSSCPADCGVCLPNAYLETSGTVVFEAERFDSQTTNGSPDTWSSANDSGAGGGQLMRLLPDNGHNYTSNVTTSSARLDYRVNFQNSGTWYMWIRGKSTTSAGYESDSCWGGINNTLISTLFDFPENGSFAWVRQTFTVPSAGVHTINVWGREDGFYLDRVVLVRSSSYTPSGVGPAESARGDSGFCGDGQCTGTEDCDSCATDCGECGYCGDNVCNTSESCSSCGVDCGACPVLGLDSRPSNTTCVAPPPLASNYGLTRRWTNIAFTNPIKLVQPPGDNTRVIVVQRAGLARSVPMNATASSAVTNFLSLSNVVTASNGGFLSLAFHPNWASNRYVYVVYTTTNLRKRLSRFQSTNGGQSLSTSTEQVILEIQHQSEFNHNGGDIAFGNDGYLYMSTGDDAYLDYTRARLSANPNNLIGKVLRIDVNSGSPYAIPPDNPFASGGGRAEVYAYGFRNPWRFSVDRLTGQLWLADVGENNWEEINIVTPGFYGWPYFEGHQCFSASSGGDCQTPYTAPFAVYGGGGAASISGGFVYRGTTMPSLYGKYVFADYVSGVVSYLDPATGVKTDIPGSTTGGAVVGFGETNAGEIYVIRYSTGQIQEIVPQSGGGATDFPATLAATGCFQSNSPTQVASGVIPFSIAQPFWSDGAGKERYLAIPDGTRITVSADGDWEFPPGAVTIKNFRNPNTNLLFETRFFVRHNNGTYSGYSYSWNDAQTQATLVPAQGASRTLPGLDWVYPTRSECFTCHTNAANFNLGPETRQFNIDAHYPATGRTANQFTTFDGIGMLTGTTTALAPFPSIGDSTVPLDTRARAYLHVNCASCHRPGGTGGGPLDARFDTLLQNKGICNALPAYGNLGNPNARLVSPGSHQNSIIWVRTSVRGLEYTMPPVASNVVDTDGVNLLAQWIDSLTACP